jgi:hypothetical protein
MQGDRDGSPEYEDLGPYSFTGFWSEFPRRPLLGNPVNRANTRPYKAKLFVEKKAFARH